MSRLPGVLLVSIEKAGRRIISVCPLCMRCPPTIRAGRSKQLAVGCHIPINA